MFRQTLVTLEVKLTKILISIRINGLVHQRIRIVIADMATVLLNLPLNRLIGRATLKLTNDVKADHT